MSMPVCPRTPLCPPGPSCKTVGTSQAGSSQESAKTTRQWKENISFPDTMTRRCFGHDYRTCVFSLFLAYVQRHLILLDLILLCSKGMQLDVQCQLCIMLCGPQATQQGEGRAEARTEAFRLQIHQASKPTSGTFPRSGF